MTANKAGGIHELTARCDEAPASLATHEVEREVEAGDHDDVAEEGMDERPHGLVALHQVAQSSLDAGAEAGEEREV